MGSPISPGAPDILAQIRHAVREESALSVSDFMLRRSFLGLGHDQGMGAVEKVAGEMGALLGWNAAEIQKQAGDYRTAAATGQYFRN